MIGKQQWSLDSWLERDMNLLPPIIIEILEELGYHTSLKEILTFWRLWGWSINLPNTVLTISLPFQLIVGFALKFPLTQTLNIYIYQQ